MAKPNINEAKKYTPITLGRVTTEPHDTDGSSYCTVVSESSAKSKQI